jgi:Uma2 family endonuclease
MATAPALLSPVLLSIDEYLNTSYKPDVDFVDGEIEERNVGTYDHAKIQLLIATLFEINGEAWQTDAVVEQRIRVSPTRVRICDVAILRADTPHEDVTATPPLICIEILSPKDRLPRAKVVLSDYLAMGVPNLWLIDPIRRIAYTFDATGLHLADTTSLTVPNTPIHLDLTAFFDRLDKKLGIRE